MSVASFPSPFGPISLREEGGFLTELIWSEVIEGQMTDLLAVAGKQLSEYFAGQRRDFDLPLRVSGSDFQRAVCDAMSAIPYGDTATYGEIAALTGNSAQAVGNACGGNPIPVIIPCHRVMGAGGKLVGFSGAGGVETKVRLLRLEGAAGLLI
ncbi:methylated-DNA--[protein]-cysteine S-methyltransferase [Aliiroseovarius lamellibrachiae]|uniref:methylated-DNA--[protein]-cysteine S-methyltransferase n=1 Tax=Aliiroseovarius lamellibrachiae TaxID=1924933 RepID=UPI001BDF8A7C|nr:methylated-DNA--[protein]-cysteine S-methyltransferase [Aliiroseovarius lamellibrachiae]MBT2129596.1 methylated-DNA--[protein]-cysteine S-methyltransferase [Aliiroseovarius lamellibrachiae]